jgi:formylglycine-generating enzyme
MQESHYIFEHDAELKRLSEMVFVEGGTFIMGSKDDDRSAYKWENPEHFVTLDSFHISKYSVTQLLWKAVMNGANSSHFICDNHPVERVSWDDTQVFIQKLQYQTGKKYRLPTEAEWEYAAKGGRYFKDFPFIYSGSDKVSEVGWYEKNSHNATKPVGLKTPNFLGIHDMSGNVWEWCNDGFDTYEILIQKSVKDSEGTLVNPTGTMRGSPILRGGYWLNTAQSCRSTNRHSQSSSYRDSDYGFRLVLA